MDVSSLEQLLEKLVPLVDDAADKVRLVVIIGVVAVMWLFVFMFWLNGVSLFLATTVTVLLALPVMLLSRFYLALEDLKNLPDMIDDVSDDLTESWHALRSGKINVGNALSGAKDLWEIRKLLTAGREMIAEYINIGVLANPISLLFAVLSVLAVFMISLLALLMGAIAIF